MESIMDDTPSNAFGVKRWSLGIIADTLFPRRATQQLKRSWEQRSRQYIELKEVDTDSHTVCVTLEFSIHFLRFKIDTNDGIIFINPDHMGFVERKVPFTYGSVGISFQYRNGVDLVVFFDGKTSWEYPHKKLVDYFKKFYVNWEFFNLHHYTPSMIARKLELPLFEYGMFKD